MGNFVLNYSYSRTLPYPIDEDSVMKDFEAVIEYVSTKSKCYAGQLFSVTGDTTENNGLYIVIKPGADGSIIKLASQESLDLVAANAGKIDKIQLNGNELEINDKVVNIELSDYSTIEYVNGEVSAITSVYVTKTDLSNSETSLKGYTDDAIEALADVYAPKAVVETLVGEDADKSARTIAAEEISKLVASAPEDYDTLKEIADYIASDKTGSAQMINDINELKAIDANNRLNTLEVDTHKHTNKEVIDTITLGDVNAWNATEQNAKDYTDAREAEIHTWVENKKYLTEHQDISGKQDAISDLETIRTNAALGATALQSVPEEYITETELNSKNYLTSVPEEYITETELNAKGYLTTHQDISGKQDVISDLEAIRSGAAAGATALQTVPAEYITETELDNKGYLTTHQDISHLATKSELTNYASKSTVETLVGEDTSKSVRTIAAEEVASVVASAPEAYDTLKEIADYIANDITSAATLANDVANLKAVNADARLDALEAISGQSHVHTNKELLDCITSEKVATWDAAEQNAKDYADTQDGAVKTWVENKNYLTEHQSLSNYYTKNEIDNKNYLIATGTEFTQLSTTVENKQDKISDLEAIRTNASKGATALQSVPSEYVTESELNAKGYLTSHQDVSHLATKAELTGYTTDSEFETLSNTVAKKSDTGHTHTATSITGGTLNIARIPTGTTSTTVARGDHEHSSYVTNDSLAESLESKQNKINDLETIRTNASKGATALQSIPSEYITESELNEKGLATVTYVNQEIGKIQNSSYDDTEIKNQLANKADKTELFSKSYNDLTDKPTIPSVDGLASEEFVREEIEAIDYVTAVDTTESVEGVSNDFVTSEQLDARDYATNSSVNSSIDDITERLVNVENFTSHDMRASVLWLGTSIPSGDINIDPEQINTYPRMVADALGFDLYNKAKAGSFVAWYPQSPSWTTSAQVAAEFATAYCLSATRQELYDKYYTVLETIRQNEGLSTTWRDDYLNDFMDSSYETLIMPYIDGTIAKCDGVVIDHGFNDRGNIFNVCSQHVTEDKDSISVWGPGSGADGIEYPVIGGNAGWWWLTHLADGRYYDGDVYMNTVYAVANGLAGNDTGGMRSEYFGAMAYIIAKIQQVDPRIRIVIGNYFSQDYGNVFGDGMNSFQTKYILQANQSIADYYGFPCVNVYKHTGLRNRTIRKPDGTTISDMYWFCPDGVHPSSDTTGVSNTIIASAYIAQIKGCFFKLG